MRLGVDLGGTKTEVIALDDGGSELYRRRVDTDPGSYDAIVATVVSLVGEAEAALGRAGTVGVGIPGAVSARTGLVKNANTNVLNGRPLDRDLGRALGREVRCANDANCLALSEAVDGAGAGRRVVFAVILGTGCGAGVAIDGRPWAGGNLVAGEWGHNPLPWPDDRERPGPRCYCGKHGCIETFLSGPGMANDHERATGTRLEAPEIAARAAAGDAGCDATLARYERRMARALATIINVLDPEIVVLGGGMSKIARLYDRVPALLPEYVFSDHVSTKLVPPVHGDASGVRGAAWLGAGMRKPGGREAG
jgi:fructokinase